MQLSFGIQQDRVRGTLEASKNFINYIPAISPIIFYSDNNVDPRPPMDQLPHWDNNASLKWIRGIPKDNLAL